MLQFALLNWMFTDTHQLKNNLFKDATELARRFRLCGILNLCVMPFVLPFLLVFFLFKHAEEFQAKKSYLGPRAWAPVTRWVFRDFNEYQHLLERRMTGAMNSANAYQRQFSWSVLSTMARCVRVSRVRVCFSWNYILFLSLYLSLYFCLKQVCFILVRQCRIGARYLGPCQRAHFGICCIRDQKLVVADGRLVRGLGCCTVCGPGSEGHDLWACSLLAPSYLLHPLDARPVAW